MSETRAKPGLLRRLSFRRRRPRSPAAAPDEAYASRPASPEALLVAAAPPPTPTPTLTSRSTSMSTLDVALAAGRSIGDLRSATATPIKHGFGECGASDRASDTDLDGRVLDSRTSDRIQDSRAMDRILDSRASDRILDSGATDSGSEDSHGHDESSSAGSAAAELHRVLLSRLECPVCYAAMAPPIRQCLFGHSVCARCEARLARCPTCRAAFLPAPNATLNAIALAVRLPCRHAGCRRHLPLADKARHEDHCPRRPFACPDAPPRCTWRGPLQAMLEHTLEQHASSASLVMLNQYASISYTYSRGRPFEIREMDGGVSHVAKSLLLVERNVSPAEEGNTNQSKKHNKLKEGAEDEDKKSPKKVGSSLRLVPRALFRFHLHFDANRVNMQAALQYVGPPANAALFRYKVSVAAEDGAFTLSAWCAATSEDVEEAVSPDGRLLRVDSAAFRHLVDAEGHFLVRVKVVVAKLPCLLQPAV